MKRVKRYTKDGITYIYVKRFLVWRLIYKYTFALETITYPGIEYGVRAAHTGKTYYKQVEKFKLLN